MGVDRSKRIRMGDRSWRTLIAAATLLCAALAVGLAQAAKLNTRTATITLASGQVIDGVTKGCTGRFRAVGGGVSLGDENDYVTGTYPLDRKQWAATGWAVIADPSSTMTVHVRCAKGLRLKRRSRSAPLSPDSGGSVTARCPRGTKVVGGGAKLSNEDSDYLLGSYPEGRRKWTAAAHRSSSDPSSIKAFAICVANRRISTERATVFVPAANDVRTARATCPRGTKPTGGGFRLGRLDGLDYGRGSYPSGRRGWAANGSRGETDDLSTTLTAYVRCLH